MYFDSNALTERKQRELRMKALENQICAAEEAMKDYSLFLCCVSPEQTQLELQQLMLTLKCDTKEFAAVRQLTSNLRLNIRDAPTQDKRIQWEHLLWLADEVLIAAAKRKADDQLRLITAVEGTGPKDDVLLLLPQTSVFSPPRPTNAAGSLKRSPIGGSTRMLLSPEKDPAAQMQPPLHRQGSPTRGRSAAQQSSDGFLTVLGSPAPLQAAANPSSEPYLNLPPLSLDRGSVPIGQATPPMPSPRHYTATTYFSTSRPQAPAPENKEVDQGQLTSHALAQQELRSMELLYEAKLDLAQRNWMTERQDLVEKMEKNDAHLRDLFAAERKQMTEGWTKERAGLVDELRSARNEIRTVKEQNRSLEDGVSKLRLVVQVLTQRLEESERRCQDSEQQRENFHQSLVRAVASAPPAALPMGGMIPPNRDSPARTPPASLSPCPVSPPPEAQRSPIKSPVHAIVDIAELLLQGGAPAQRTQQQPLDVRSQSSESYMSVSPVNGSSA